MLGSSVDTVTPLIAQAIEDAVLFGHIREIDAILDIVEDDDNFPQNLRYGLESLRYFREFYGAGGDGQTDEWLQRQKIAVMESAWGSNLLEMLRQGSALSVRHA